MMERGLRSQPARIDSSKLVVKKITASAAVVRVSTVAVPPPRRNPAGRADAEPAPFRLLQQHHPDHGKHDHEMNENEHDLHASTCRCAFSPRVPPPPGVI